jgi:hypothetical protein
LFPPEVVCPHPTKGRGFLEHTYTTESESSLERDGIILYNNLLGCCLYRLGLGLGSLGGVTGQVFKTNG